jgi:hypothetical protein
MKTTMRRVPQQQRNPGVRRERDRRALVRQSVLLLCGLAMAGGFVIAVGQHYTAVRYGYEGERLRAERVRLLAERDRLLLELSAAESPVMLERAARGIGMQPARSSQIAVSRKPVEQPAAAADTAATVARADSARKSKGAREPQAGARSAEPDERKVSADERARVVGGGDTRPRIVESGAKRSL